jgi:hypothetical protein
MKSDYENLSRRLPAEYPMVVSHAEPDEEIHSKNDAKIRGGFWAS